MVDIRIRRCSRSPSSAEVFAELLVPERAESLQYTASVGLSLLRAQVAERLSRDGIACTAEDVLIIQGGQQGLDLAARMMIDPGDVVITENPTFLGSADRVQSVRADVRHGVQRR